MEHKNNYAYLQSLCHRKRISIVKSELDKHNCVGRNLSIGCGDGHLEMDFPGNFVGFDIRKISNPRIPIKIGDVKEINSFFKENEFDAIFMGEIIEHIYDTNKLLISIGDILKADGILIITVPNILSFRDRFRCLFGYSSRHLNGYLENEHLYEHIRHFGKKSIKALLEKHNFEVLRVATPSLSYNPFNVNSTQEITNIPDFLSGLGNNLIITAVNRN